MSARFLLAAFMAGAAIANPFSNIEARKLPFGTAIFQCTEPDTIALTFDDGPYIYTADILDMFNAAGAKGTFFLNGHNWGYMTDHKSTVQRMLAEGHQIGHHTWSHPNLADLDADEIADEMIELEDALIGVIGKFPTYMRPPFFSYTDATLQTLGELGYHVIHANIDTNDWSFQNECLIENAVKMFEEGVSRGGSIVLAHDVHLLTAYTLVPAMLQMVKDRGLRAVTVGECLGDPEANWYRTHRDGHTPPPPPIGGPGPNGICGGPNQYTCEMEGYPCCSQFGYCGNTPDHCEAGCNPEFGWCSPL
ncbi:hypothetical protein jhhlp_000697 [Lomentospora prolificans]|uniref:NodB homology domain-containing protein n=1 Tax=Lomentospora prolificans TaxID=41688 RepID=A0A2N3NJ75_9PEZI|nr:hypothetical protein jhhlp_000697 [Lomentospora prolificans]